MKRHSTDLVSLIFAVIFLVIAAGWLVSRYLDITVPHGGWIVAGVLILIGLFGVVGSLRGERRPDAAAPPPSAVPVDEPVGRPDPTLVGAPVSAEPATVAFEKDAAAEAGQGEPSDRPPGTLD